jgi:hypothetical protein
MAACGSATMSPPAVVHVCAALVSYLFHVAPGPSSLLNPETVTGVDAVALVCDSKNRAIVAPITDAVRGTASAMSGKRNAVRYLPAASWPSLRVVPPHAATVGVALASVHDVSSPYQTDGSTCTGNAASANQSGSTATVSV